MTIKIAPGETSHLKPRITVIGVGGGGCNAVNNMIRANLEGVDFIATNTDAQALEQSAAGVKIQLGGTLTKGLGAGSRPDVGRAAAEESIDEITDHLQGTNMAFITVGLGGGTGTGAAPVIAEALRNMGILTVAVCTKPFHFEGLRRMEYAEQGVKELAKIVDTLIIIPNQNLFRIANEKTSFADAFKMADDVLYSGVRGITDLIVMPGHINLDFADIRTVMSEMGKAMMGTGEAEGEDRATEAAQAAIENPLLDDICIKGARGVLINITGGYDMTLMEVDAAAGRIREEVDPNANIIFGSTFDESMAGKMRVSVVATGIDADPAAVDYHRQQQQQAEQMRRSQSSYTPAAGSAYAVRPQPQQQPQRAQTSSFAPPQPQQAVRPQPTPSIRPATVSAVAQANASSMNSATPPARMAPSPVVEDGRDALTLDEPFLGGPAVETPYVAEAQGAADPFAAAAMANGGRVADARSGGKKPTADAPRPPSLFERMTGFGRKADEPAAASSSPSPSPSGPSLSAAASGASTSMNEPSAPSPSSSRDDDLLDIPAFLRRQAS